MDNRNDETRATRALKTACWAGAIADALVGIALFVPSMWGRVIGVANFEPDLQHRLDMALGGTMLLGWTCLLLWAARAPLARRGVVVITLFPVLVGLSLTTAVAVATGTLSAWDIAWLIGMKTALYGLLGYALFVSRGAGRARASSRAAATGQDAAAT